MLTEQDITKEAIEEALSEGFLNDEESAQWTEDNNRRAKENSTE